MLRILQIILIVFLSYCVQRFSSLADCKRDQPCAFLGKDVNWQVIIEESPQSQPQPYPPASDSWKSNITTLHIAISSFRDKLCPQTLYNIFSKSAHPERITVGVVQQNEDGDIDCLEGYCKIAETDSALMSKSTKNTCAFRDHVKMTRVSAQTAQGPVWARALGSKLISDEEFCMQIDAHMDFAPDFDIHMLGSLPFAA
jgi:hypothetical protein